MAGTSRSQRLDESDASGMRDGSHDSDVYRTAEQTLYLDPVCSESMLESAESARIIADRIEWSKRHWSELSIGAKVGCSEVGAGDSVELGAIDEELEQAQAMVAEDNRALYKTLESHPKWGGFFWSWDDFAALEVGQKFAEGGQAELFHVRVTWKNPEDNAEDEEDGVEYVLKVFKKGTSLQYLQSQWPQGMLQYRAEEFVNWRSSNPKELIRYFCNVQSGVLLQDGRFAFLMEREMQDLSSLIEKRMAMRIGQNCGPFSKEDAEEIMFNVALGMAWLHSRNIIHRDLKASNVLIRILKDGNYNCFVADYECSIGVVGTGFFRAPEILEACKDKSISSKLELFTIASDVYSFGMTCYEILIGQLPFDGHKISNYDLVLDGGRPEVPKYVDDWMVELMNRCWEVDPQARPSFDDILTLILSNSMYLKRLVEKGEFILDHLDWVKWKV